MEHLAVFEEKIMLSPMDLRTEIRSFDAILLDKLRKKIEGKCSQHGYVIPNSLTLLSRSLGYAEKGRFTGDFMYHVKVQGKVYHPPEGIQVEGEVVRKNKMGLYVIIEDAIRIMIPRDLHIGNDEFDSIQIGEMIRIEIKKCQFQIHDSHILCVGQFLGRAGAQAIKSTESLVESEGEGEGEASPKPEGEASPKPEGEASPKPEGEAIPKPEEKDLDAEDENNSEEDEEEE
jgi:DNA-directed RNA polymerase subunit E'/Rpb7